MVHKLSGQVVHKLSGQVAHATIREWSGLFSVFPPSHPLFFLPSTVSSGVMGAWNGGSWLGYVDLPAMGAVFYLGGGWPQWKPLGIAGTYLPLKQGTRHKAQGKG